MKFFKFYLFIWYVIYNFIFYKKKIIINLIIIFFKLFYFLEIYSINYILFKINYENYFSFWNYFYYGNKTYPTTFEDVYAALVTRKIHRFKRGHRNRLLYYFERKLLQFSTKQSYVVFPEFEHYWYFIYRTRYWKMREFFGIMIYFLIYLFLIYLEKKCKSNNFLNLVENVE